MKNSVASLFIASIIVFVNSPQVRADGACDRNVRYFMALSEAARIDPQGAIKAMGKNRDHYIARASQVRSGEVRESVCRQFVAAIQQNWDLNIQAIFPKLKRTQKPRSASENACARAFIIISNFAQKRKSPIRFGVYVWAANTALVRSVECQWIVDGYS
jgi:hypothetical protein